MHVTPADFHALVERVAVLEAECALTADRFASFLSGVQHRAAAMAAAFESWAAGTEAVLAAYDRDDLDAQEMGLCYLRSQAAQLRCLVDDFTTDDVLTPIGV